MTKPLPCEGCAFRSAGWRCENARSSYYAALVNRPGHRVTHCDDRTTVRVNEVPRVMGHVAAPQITIRSEKRRRIAP